jgi:hypothetical protein
MRKMRPGNARILLTELYAPSRPQWKRQFPALRSRLAIRPSDFAHLEGFPWKHADAQRWFSARDRYFALMVDFTNAKARDRLLPAVNASLRTFAIAG